MTARNGKKDAVSSGGKGKRAKAKRGKSKDIPPSSAVREMSHAKDPAAGSGNLADILTAASTHASAGNMDEAVCLFERAANLSPRNAEILAGLGEALMEAGREEESVAAFKKCIELAPAVGFEKYMYLSQLLGNTMEAVEVSKAGLAVLRNEKQACSGDDRRREELANFEVSALCGIAEVLLSVIEESQDEKTADLLDADVERSIGEALGICAPGSQGEMEASMTLANLRLSQARQTDARAAMLRVVAAMRAGLDVLDDENGGDDAIVKGIGMLPPMEFRLAAGKQLLEVQLWNDAAEVFSSTLHECDFNVEVWYLLAMAFHEGGTRDSALAALEQARATIASPDEHIGQVPEELLNELESRMHESESPTNFDEEGDTMTNCEQSGNDMSDIDSKNTRQDKKD